MNSFSSSIAGGRPIETGSTNRFQLFIRSSFRLTMVHRKKNHRVIRHKKKTHRYKTNSNTCSAIASKLNCSMTHRRSTPMLIRKLLNWFICTVFIMFYTDEISQLYLYTLLIEINDDSAIVTVSWYQMKT